MSDLTRSQHADRFNHDKQVGGYDANVSDESNPVRAGYAAALKWVAERCNLAAAVHLLELGCGTGNLTKRLVAADITAVDISNEMMALAAGKISPRKRVHFVQADALEFSGTLPPGSLDVITSTYALHHLTDSEKPVLLRRLSTALRPHSRFVIADLMFADSAHRARVIDDFARAGQRSLVDSIQEEFYWDVSAAHSWLTDLGYSCEWVQVSQLSWCVEAIR